LPEPGLYNFVSDTFHRWVEETPDAAALLWTDGTDDVVISFADMKRRASVAAGLLLDAGIRRGDMVIVLLGRELPWWEIMLGCLQIGAIASPGTIQLSATDIAYRVQASGARAIIAGVASSSNVDAAEIGAATLRFHVGGVRQGWLDYDTLAAIGLPRLEAAPTRADEDALCYFTSGTTGYPKMTIHRHDYPVCHAATGSEWLGLAPGTLCWNLADTGWAKAAWSSLFAPWSCGATILAHHSGSFDAEAAIALMERLPVHALCAPPTAYRMMLQAGLAGRRFPSLRHCVAAGEPIGREVVETWQTATGIIIRVGYGQTETALLCADRVGELVRPGAMGRAMTGFNLAVIDEHGHLVASGAEGDVALKVVPDRPLGLFACYRGDPARTEATRRGDWYLTGDRAIVDGDGYFWFVGRSDDVILSSGYRIGPFEVESALNSHDAVLESAVVSSPDDARGEIVKAFVTLASGYEASDALAVELQAHVKAVTAPYKYPRAIDFVDALPKTVSGKILRRELRDQEWGR